MLALHYRLADGHCRYIKELEGIEVAVSVSSVQKDPHDFRPNWSNKGPGPKSRMIGKAGSQY